MEASQHAWPALGVLLLRDALVTKDDLESVLAEQRDEREQRISSRRLGEVLVERGIVTGEAIARLVAEQYELPFLELEAHQIDRHAASSLSPEDARTFGAVPISRRADGSYLVAIADPSVVFSDQIRLLLGAATHFAVIGPEDMERALELLESDPTGTDAVDHGLSGDDRGVVVELRSESTPSTSNWEPTESTFALPPVTQLWPLLGALLVRDGLLTDDQLETALEQQRLTSGRRLGEIVVELGLAQPSDIARLIAEQYELPYVDLQAADVSHTVARLIPETVSRQYGAVPVEAHADGSLTVAISDPTTFFHSDDFHGAIGVPVSFVVASPEAIQSLTQAVHDPAEDIDATLLDAARDVTSEPAVAIDLAPAPDTGDELDPAASEPRAVPVPEAGFEPWDIAPVEVTAEHAPTDDADLASAPDPVLIEPHPNDFGDAGHTTLESEQHEHPVGEAEREAEGSSPVARVEFALAAPAVAAVPSAPDDMIVGEAHVAAALRLGASALHLSPRDDGYALRARVDGRVESLGFLSEDDRADLLERAVRDHGGRVHILPTARGEKVTIVFGAHAEAPTTLDGLGLTTAAESAFRAALERSEGAVVVSGPRDSGVTTTLYAALASLGDPDHRIVATVASRGERTIDGVDQVEIDEASGNGTVAVLEQLRDADYDTILVASVDDADTAELAVRLAASGRQLLLGLEAVGAASTLRRLVDLGVDADLLARGLGCVVSQRLVRRVCTSCRETYYASQDDLADLGEPAETSRLLARGRGCRDCAGSGYLGRTAIFEVLTLTDEIVQLVRNGASPDALHEAAVAHGMEPIEVALVRLCLDGATTTAEARAVANLDA